MSVGFFQQFLDAQLRTCVCDQVAGNDPSHALNALEVLDDGHQGRTDDGNLDIDKEHASAASAIAISWEAIDVVRRLLR